MSYTRQNFANDQVLDAQHLKNIEDAIVQLDDTKMSNVAVSYLDMNGHSIDNVSMITLGDNQGAPRLYEGKMASLDDTPVMLIGCYDERDIVIRGVANGKYDTDAVNLKQLNAAVGKCVKLTENGHLDMLNCAIYGVSGLTFGYDQNDTIGIRRSATEQNQTLALVFEDGGQAPVMLRNVADGVRDYDAATVGQLNAAVADCVKVNENGDVVLPFLYISNETFDFGAWIEPEADDGDHAGVLKFSNMTDDGPVRLRRIAAPVHDTDAANKAYVDSVVSSGGSVDTSDCMKKVADSDLDMNGYTIERALGLRLCNPGVESSTELCMSTDGPGNWYFCISHEDGYHPIIRGIANGINEYDAATVGQLNAAVGDIESALDSIIAIQNGFIGGETA